MSTYVNQSLGGNMRACEALGLLMFWRGAQSGISDTFYLINPTTGAVYRPGTTGTAPPGNGGGEWVEELGTHGQFIYCDGRGSNTVWRLTPSANPIVAPWAWTSEEVAGPPAYVQRSGLAHYSRFRWVPARKVFLWVSDSVNPVQAWRL